jgi:ADP-dependent NAD(P)H-hydrate dehydratase / NAD(P)H-hydrate epimerase
MRVVSSEQMRALEHSVIRGDITEDRLMQRAGAAVARYAGELAGRGLIVVLVGPGNNGGDGLVAAEHLSRSGRSVIAYTFRRDTPSTLPFLVVRSDGDENLDALESLLCKSSLVVDALLGTGQSRPVSGPLAEIVGCANASRLAGRTSLAVDISTGISADTGDVLGSAFRADVTLSMAFPKRGSILYPGAAYAGKVRVVDIGIASQPSRDSEIFVPAPEDIARLLPLRPPDSNKGSFGRVLLVGGSRSFLGAPVLSSTAAYRIGAGLVEVGTPLLVELAIAAQVPEPIFRRLPEEEGKLSVASLPDISAALQRSDALIFGPGMGLSDQTVHLAQGVLDAVSTAKINGAVFDADGLNALSRIPRWWQAVQSLVVTPHPGEMSRLTGLAIEEVQRDRLAVARDHARIWGQVVVLKGAGTVVAAPDGSTWINPTGAANLATAGTGDVLSGIIGGLIAQGCSPADAARAGVYLHGLAGDMLAKELGDAGTLAADLLDRIPYGRRRILENFKERG